MIRRTFLAAIAALPFWRKSSTETDQKSAPAMMNPYLDEGFRQRLCRLQNQPWLRLIHREPIGSGDDWWETWECHTPKQTLRKSYIRHKDNTLSLVRYSIVPHFSA